MTPDTIDIFTFGKYRHRAMHEIIQVDPGYICWAYVTVQDSGIPEALYLKALPGARKAKAQYAKAKAAAERPRKGLVASWWDPNEKFIPREARQEPTRQMPTPQPVYYADGSGYMPGSGPAGPLYFDKFGNT